MSISEVVKGSVHLNISALHVEGVCGSSGEVEQLDVFLAYLAYLILLAGALLWGWNGAGTAGSGRVMILELW